MLLCLSCNGERRLTLFFRETPADTLSIHDGSFARLVVHRLEHGFGAQFGNQQDDILSDDVWREGVIEGKRIEVSMTYHSGCSIRALESAADGVILDIAASLSRRPIDVD